MPGAAVVFADWQGFQLGQEGEYLIRELALVELGSERAPERFLFRQPLSPCYLTRSARDHMHVTTRKVHGLEWSATEGLPAAALGKILASRLPANCLVVCKGAEKTSLLAQAGPPTCTYKNIEDDEVRVPPALRALRTANRTHHCRSPAHHGRRLLNCAAENASNLHRWWTAEAKVNTFNKIQLVSQCKPLCFSL